MKRNFDCTPLESASRETHRGDRGQEAAEPARHSDAVCQQVRFFAPREQKRGAGGNLFAEYGAGVVCAMGVVGGQLHDPEKEWSDLRTARDRIRLAQATLLRMATKRGG